MLSSDSMGSEQHPDDVATLLHASHADASQAAARAFRLSVVEGAEAGRSFVVDGARSRIYIGQSPSCEINLKDPHVSRRHAALDVVDGGLRLTDLDSTNG